MSLWLVLFVGTQIGGTWGPLPYEMDVCLAKAAEGNAIVDQAKGRPEIIARFRGKEAPLEQWHFECRVQSDRPQLTME